MKIDKIKPIPKYIISKIKNKDKNFTGKPGQVRFYSYLTKNDGELCKVTCAVKYHNNKFYCKQCIIYGIKSKYKFVKDMAFTYIAGYTVGWYDEGLYKNKKYCDDGEWWISDYGNLFNPYSKLLNKEYLNKCEEYKYAAWEKYTGDCIIEYLKQYDAYPEIEYLMKANLQNLIFSNQILNKLNKDKKFKKWLIQNKEEIHYDTYITSIIKAYNKNLSINYVDTYEKSIKNIKKSCGLPELCKNNKEKLAHYISKNKTNMSTYKDYIAACTYLHIDLTDSKNVFPIEFQKWHDIRADQFATKKAEDDAIKRKELYEKFANVSSKYKNLEMLINENYACLIAKSPAELIKEGDALKHCVGRMNYDQKFAREETLIFFIRESNNIEQPLATVEYSISRKTVLQCYAFNDKKPNDNILKFVYDKWLPYANRKLKKICA